jgi:putative transposase
MESTLKINAIFNPVDELAPFKLPCRLLWIDEKEDRAVLITIEEEPKKPWEYQCSALRSLLHERKIIAVQLNVPDFMLLLEDEIAEKHRAKRDTNWKRIKPILQAAPNGEIFQADTMGALIKAHYEATGVEKKTLYRLLYRYWMFGSVRNGLLPNYPASGGKGKTKRYESGNLPGRPPRVLESSSKGRAKVLNEQDKIAIRIGYALYKDNEVKTKVDAYTRMLGKFYCESIPTPGFPESSVTLKPLEELPTQAQFEYWGRKAFDDMTVLRSRKGERKWAMDHRALKGRSFQGTFGPCHRFEIDATIADIYLVSRFNRHWIIGRPVVYVVVDVFSRMIVGLFVGLEGPSWNGARQALLNTFRDKVSFCARYGVHIRAEDWPCSHLPQEICADRGEMLGQAAEGIVPALGIDLAIAPPYRPDWKAIVESSFRILNQLTQIHWIPGGVAQRIKERGERDYREDATLNLKEFTSIIIKAVLQYNRYSRHPDFLNEHMIAEGVSPTSLAMWNWGIEHGFGTPNQQVEELVNLHLMTRAVGRVEAGGIQLAGMYFVPENERESSRFSRAREKGHQAIDVWHDVTAPEHIWIRGEDKSLQRCVWRESETRYRDSRFEEIHDMQMNVGYVGPEERHAELASKVNLDRSIQATINTASAEKKGSPKPSSKRAQIGRIRENRAIERAAESTPNQFETKKTIAPTPQPSAYTSESYGQRSAEVIDILAQLRKKPRNA